MQSEKTNNLINYFTLQISNKEIARRFQTHQARKIDRLLYGAVLCQGVFLVLRIVNEAIVNTGLWVAVLHDATIFSLLVAFCVFRHF